jgi:hypothetical protein
LGEHIQKEANSEKEVPPCFERDRHRQQMNASYLKHPSELVLANEKVGKKTSAIT